MHFLTTESKHINAVTGKLLMSVDTLAYSPEEIPPLNTVLVTSPAGGIGKPLILHLLNLGYHVVAMGSENGVLFTDYLKAEGMLIDYIYCDYFSEASIQNAFAQAKSRNASLDGFIHLAGGSLFSSPIEKIPADDFRKVLDLNLTSAFLMGKEAYRWMQQTNGGNIIFFGSTSGISPSSHKTPYAVAKAGVHALTKSFALEGSKYGIIVNAIAPGYILTERHEDELREKATLRKLSYEELLDTLREKNPLGELLSVQDIFPTVDLLLTTTKMQGQIITIDLGQTF